MCNTLILCVCVYYIYLMDTGINRHHAFDIPTLYIHA